MMRRTLFAGTALAVCAMATVLFAQSRETHTAAPGERYLPEYTKEGDLILPKNRRSWVYVGSPLTPDALNSGKTGFPEYHNVYIEPGSFEIYKETGEFPDGTIFFKELQRTQTPGWEPTLGFPTLSALPGQFLLKDIVLFGAAVWSLGESLKSVSA